MKITKIQVNHMDTPVGYDLSDLKISFALENMTLTNLTKKLVIWTTEPTQPVYETESKKYTDNSFDVSLDLQPRTRYHFKIVVDNGNEEVEATSYFETGKMTEQFIGQWIANANKNIQNTLFKKEFTLSKLPDHARFYITGLGLYEAYLNGQKIGQEYLTPGVTAYDKWVQVQTYDITALLRSNETNKLVISTADGWYKGNYGFDGGQDNIYGDQQMVIAEVHLVNVDRSETSFGTDDSWQTTSGQITKSSIYYGEDIDGTITPNSWQPVTVLNKDTSVLGDRLSLPITIHGTLAPQELIITPKKEQVLDFGQNHAGWIEFYNREPKGTKITLQVGEILQEGNFYRDNLRDARAALTYISDGKEGWVRPHFTYYGFRYVKVTGNTQPLKLEDFRAPVLYSDIQKTGNIETDNKLVNRLFKNIQWGQRSNFLDVPTDCPQRDERLGWTGDADIFSNTAALNMNVFEFFKKYAMDMKIEQEKHNGMLTMYAPAMGVDDGGAAVWGDAATFIPWNMYQAYGDDAILKQNYSSMKAWVDWITTHTKKKNLWAGTFQFGDWIALDGEVPGLPTGKTDEDYIASAYYYASSKILAQTAQILGKTDDAAQYHQQAENILAAIHDEYITNNGRLAIDTQTAYALALYFDLVPKDQKSRVAADLVARLHKDNDHLKTGFVGTPFINQVLSDNGYHKLAMKIFMQEDFPSWLYAVKMGATTVWERWNSVMEDGSMNPEGMNSLNHYSIGAVMEWAYRYVLGIRQQTNGYQTIEYAPLFDYRLKHVKGHYDSSYGRFSAEYQLEADEHHTIKLTLTIPVGVTVNVKLPRAKTVDVNGKIVGSQFSLQAGSYDISYIPSHDYIERYSATTAVKNIMADQELVAKIDQVSSALKMFENDPGTLQGPLAGMSLQKINTIIPSVNIPESEFKSIEKILTTMPILSERS